jgi:hypothetical protein
LNVISGFSRDGGRYQTLVKKVYDDTLRAGKIFGQANAIYATGYRLSGDVEFYKNGPSIHGSKPRAA